MSHQNNEFKPLSDEEKEQYKSQIQDRNALMSHLVYQITKNNRFLKIIHQQPKQQAKLRTETLKKTEFMKRFLWEITSAHISEFETVAAKHMDNMKHYNVEPDSPEDVDGELQD